MDRKKSGAADRSNGTKFGVTRQIDRRERVPIWPTWLVTLAIKLGIINPGPYSG